MNIQDTTMMYPNDKLLQPLADAKHSDNSLTNVIDEV